MICGVVPSYYLRYFYFHDEVVGEERERPSRAAEVAAIERELMELYGDPTLDHKPELLAKRGGAFYSEAAVALIASLFGDSGDEQVVNVRNFGTLPFLSDDAVIEVPATIKAAGPVPVPVAPIEPLFRGSSPTCPPTRSWPSTRRRATEPPARRVDGEPPRRRTRGRQPPESGSIGATGTGTGPAALIEVPATIKAAGPVPVPVAPIEPLFRLIAHVSAYEELAIDAALRGGRSRVAAALLAHPPVLGQYDVANKMADRLIAENAQFLSW